MGKLKAFIPQKGFHVVVDDGTGAYYLKHVIDHTAYAKAVAALRTIARSGSEEQIKNIFCAQDTLRELGEL